MGTSTSHVVTALTAIVSLAGLEAMAIYRGIDGAFFYPVVVAIAAIAGVSVKEVINALTGRDSNSRRK